MGPRRIRRPGVTLVAALLVAACGGTAPSAGPSGAIPGGPTGGPATAEPGGSGQAAGPGATIDLTAPYAPVDLDIQLDATHAAESLVPVAGGSVTATGADGTTYTLEIPADALPGETRIELIPASSVAGSPFGTGATYAVQMRPNGLSLLNFATLTIVPAQPIPADDQIEFAYLGNGTDVIAAAPVIGAADVKIRVLHFSGAGVTSGAAFGASPAAQALGGDAERRIEGAINRLLQEERQRQLRGEAADPGVLQAVDDLLDQYAEEVVKARIAGASASCDAGTAAVQAVLTVERSRQLLGLSTEANSLQETFVDALNKAVRACVLEEFEECAEHHTIFRMLPVYHGVLRQHALFPVLTPGTLEEARDLTIKCLTFRLVLESTAKLNQAGWTHESSVEAEVVLRFKPDALLINGFGPYTNTSYESALPLCTVKTTTGGGTLAVLGLVYDIDSGAPDSDGNYPNVAVKDFSLTYSVDNSTETMSISCPDGPSTPASPYPVWSLCFYDARVSQIDTGSGLTETEWEVHPGEELMAEKDWDKVGIEDPNCRESGSFEIHHAPGA